MPERLTIWHETKGDSKIPIFQLFSELGEIWKYKLLKLINTNLSFPSVSWLGKNCEVQLQQHSKIPPKKKKFKVEPKTNIQKFQFKSKGEMRTAKSQYEFHCWKKVGNLHKIRVDTFQTTLLCLIVWGSQIAHFGKKSLKLI